MTTYVKAPVVFYALGGVVGDSAAHAAFAAFADYAKEGASSIHLRTTS